MNSVEFEILGVTYKATINFANICAYEQKTGKTNSQLLNGLVKGSIGVGETVKVIHSCLDFEDSIKVSEAKFGDMVVQHGHQKVWTLATAIIACASSGRSLSEVYYDKEESKKNTSSPAEPKP